ncbi:hypothetical protein D3C76_224540 [compost metagenome]
MSVRINRYSMALVRESSKVYEVDKQIESPSDASQVIHSLLDVDSLHVENFGILTLDTKNNVIGFHILQIGSLNASVASPRNVFQAALLNNAASFIMFHNHPSGDPTPSNEDIEITNRITEIGNLMGIEALDHIIVANGKRYQSIREYGR